MNPLTHHSLTLSLTPTECIHKEYLMRTINPVAYHALLSYESNQPYKTRPLC